MEEIRIGIAGLGNRGLAWVDQLTKITGYRITALYDFIEPLHERALAAIPYRDEVKTFTDYEEFLAFDGMEAVGLNVRCKNQGAMAAQALEAGKHVHSEVPAAHTIKDCWRIVLAAERSGQVYQLAEQLRYWGYIDGWREMVAKGLLGKVIYCEGQYLAHYPDQYFQDMKTGRFCPIDELGDHPDAKPTWLQEMPPIHYLVHDLSPILKITGDRIKEVVGMGTRAPSYTHPEINQSDLQVALMKTERDAMVRMAVGFTVHAPHGQHHWLQVIGTHGRVEWRKTDNDKPKMWVSNLQMHDMCEVDWRPARTDAPPEALGSGHDDADYYIHAAFRDAVLGKKSVELDAYAAVEIAAAGILAADSIERNSERMIMPDFRPSDARPAGQEPRDMSKTE